MAAIRCAKEHTAATARFDRSASLLNAGGRHA